LSAARPPEGASAPSGGSDPHAVRERGGERLVAAAPQIGDAWVAAMRRGDWREAWRLTDSVELPRRVAQREPGFVRDPDHLCWDGTPFDGRSVLVRCEHGLGDTLQFIRFVPALTRIAREVHVMVQPLLLDLFAGAPELGTVHNGWTEWWPPPAHDVEIEIMELAYAFRATPASVPPPYPHLAERVRGRLPIALPQDGALRAGLVWAASEWDTTRSVPLASLEPLLRVPGVRCFSLQQGAAAEDPLIERLPLEPLSRWTQDIAVAAAAMLELDLVVTVDNMVAHLAAMLGRPTCVLLKQEADWRWMDDRGDSPWYPTVRLFRQEREGDWSQVVHEMTGALATLATARSAHNGYLDAGSGPA
jgi:hypothetical protein